jgi:hypothetical protein
MSWSRKRERPERRPTQVAAWIRALLSLLSVGSDCLPVGLHLDLRTRAQWSRLGLISLGLLIDTQEKQKLQTTSATPGSMKLGRCLLDLPVHDE